MEDVFIDVSDRNPHDLPDGIYHISLVAKGHEYRAEKREGRWFFADGTGWQEPLLREQAFVALRFYPMAKDPRLKSDTKREYEI